MTYCETSGGEKFDAVYEISFPATEAISSSDFHVKCISLHIFYPSRKQNAAQADRIPNPPLVLPHIGTPLVLQGPDRPTLEKKF